MNLGCLVKMRVKTLNVNKMEVSECCGASRWFDESDICSQCKEHTDFYTEE